jgi:putative membrane protein
MQFLKTLFWFLLAVSVAVFSIGNWTTVPIKLWAGLIAEVNLPLLLVLTFLAGLFPVLLFHHAVKWRMSQKLSTAERAVADLRAAAQAALPPAPTSLATPDGPIIPSNPA